MSASKNLIDFFQPAKRMKKLSSSSSSSFSSPSDSSKTLQSVSLITASSSSSFLCKSANSDICDGTPSSALPSVTLTAVQKSRIEFNKLRAISRKNLKICLDRISKSSSEGLDFVKLEQLLVEETWLEALPGELQKPYANELCKFIQSEIRGDSGVPIYPPLHLIFNALNTTPFDRVKAVIIGQDPYHGPGQAMGLSFSVPQGIKVPSSLVNIYKELKQDLSCSIPSHGNLEGWAVQGVLLLNAVLTVRQGQANSHAKKGWEQFTDAVIKAISLKKKGVVFLLWGNYAHAKSKLIDETKHHILKAAHPSGLSANRGFFGCRHFSRTNKLLEQMGISQIDWQL
ncbi:uracil-DNA glycosylase, mitochondrial [Actinidia eriantha]|uniref:uracil-DNA glycosylase, mitochondrial n=1 Tax=Actinidia eriantha TaxID=165200 RepID=UPI0025883159|nr:uracil-DNA glycosylase, mitochondrial [Actinidia eriantha]